MLELTREVDGEAIGHERRHYEAGAMIIPQSLSAVRRLEWAESALTLRLSGSHGKSTNELPHDVVILRDEPTLHRHVFAEWRTNAARRSTSWPFVRPSAAFDRTLSPRRSEKREAVKSSQRTVRSCRGHSSVDRSDDLTETLDFSFGDALPDRFAQSVSFVFDSLSLCRS